MVVPSQIVAVVHPLLMIRELFKNQLVGGGLILMFTGSIIALLRNLPSTIMGKIRSQFVVSVSVLETDPLFEWITIWLADNPYSKKTRRIRAKTKEESRSEREEKEKEGNSKLPEILYSPAHGEHFFFYEGRFIWLSRGKEGNDKAPASGAETGGNDFMKRLAPDQYTFRTIGR